MTDNNCEWTYHSDARRCVCACGNKIHNVDGCERCYAECRLKSNWADRLHALAKRHYLRIKAAIGLAPTCRCDQRYVMVMAWLRRAGRALSLPAALACGGPAGVGRVERVPGQDEDRGQLAARPPLAHGVGSDAEPGGKLVGGEEV